MIFATFCSRDLAKLVCTSGTWCLASPIPKSFSLHRTGFSRTIVINPNHLPKFSQTLVNHPYTMIMFPNPEDFQHGCTAFFHAAGAAHFASSMDAASKRVCGPTTPHSRRDPSGAKIVVTEMTPRLAPERCMSCTSNERLWSLGQSPEIKDLVVIIH